MINAEIDEDNYEMKAPMLLRAIHRSGMIVLATEIREVTFDGYILLKTDRAFYEVGEVATFELEEFEPFRGKLSIGNVPLL